MEERQVTGTSGSPGPSCLEVYESVDSEFGGLWGKARAWAREGLNPRVTSTCKPGKAKHIPYTGAGGLSLSQSLHTLSSRDKPWLICWVDGGFPARALNFTHQQAPGLMGAA